MPYHFPSPQQFLGYARKWPEGHPLGAALTTSAHRRIAGLGIAAPFELWNWGEEIGAPQEVMEAWKEFNLTAEIMQLCDWPVMPCNDATAACAAELLFGTGHRYRDFAYLYVGYFAGGGLVLNGHPASGPNRKCRRFRIVAGAQGRWWQRAVDSFRLALPSGAGHFMRRAWRAGPDVAPEGNDWSQRRSARSGRGSSSAAKRTGLRHRQHRQRGRLRRPSSSMAPCRLRCAAALVDATRS